MSFINNDPESLPLTSLKAMEISTSSKLPLKTIEKKNIRSHPKRISEIERMIMLNHKCNCSENCEKKCEAGKIEPADDRDKTYSLPPAPESLSLTSSNDIENPTSSQLSVGKKMANNLTEAQIDILLKDLCKRVDDRKKRREAGNLDPNDPQDIPLLCSFVPSSEEKRSFRHSEKYLEYKKKKSEKRLEFKKQQQEKRPLYYQWRSECEEIEKTTKLTYDQKFAIWRKMKVEHDKSSGE